MVIGSVGSLFEDIAGQYIGAREFIKKFLAGVPLVSGIILVVLAALAIWFRVLVAPAVLTLVLGVNFILSALACRGLIHWYPNFCRQQTRRDYDN